MNNIADNLSEVRINCEKSAAVSKRKPDAVTLIAVSKTFDSNEIRPALIEGQRVYGENRVQEAQGKWSELKQDFNDVELHLIGPLQSNKAGDAVGLFDVIHTVDREKIASALAKEMKKQNRKVSLFIQVNTGSEPQKAGIEPENTEAFHNLCREKYGLEFSGLMCIPPVNENPGPHFALLRKLAQKLDLTALSMGMSSDYETAIEMGATHVRVGSAIFGSRA
jgi:pyridoxal phosphate enzyme (YggS family)